MQLRTNLLAGGRCLTVLPLSIVELFGERHSIVALPVALPERDWPVIMATLKDRTLNPVAHLFMDAVRKQMVQSLFTKS